MYDYAIIGAGAAGLQLALALCQEDLLKDKTILILDPDSKSANDKTWCYWEKGNGRFDEILSAKWDKALFFGGQKALELPLGEYTYKKLKAIDFYNYAKNILAGFQNVTWKKEEVLDLIEGNDVEIKAKETYYATHVFDSRWPITYAQLKQSNGVLQHFLGWEIETKEAIFDVHSFTMMDYRLKWPDTTSFMYVLPTEKNKALVEFTFFSPDLVNKEDYEKMIKQYIKEKLKIEDYAIKATEQGVIPMYDYPFHKHNSSGITKIGTAGGWVKPSSGYSFKSSGNKIIQLIENLKRNHLPSKGLHNKKHALYDATFLSVLEKDNHLGEKMFTSMYTKNGIGMVLSFLDEETSFLQELKIMSSFPKKNKLALAMFSSIFS